MAIKNWQKTYDKPDMIIWRKINAKSGEEYDKKIIQVIRFSKEGKYELVLENKKRKSMFDSKQRAISVAKSYMRTH